MINPPRPTVIEVEKPGRFSIIEIGIPGRPGPKGDGGGSTAAGDVEATPNTIVLRDAGGGIRASIVQAQLLYAPAARPAFIQQPVLIKHTMPEGQLDGTKIYYFTSLIITADFSFWVEPELAVRMDGANTVEIQTAVFDTSKIAAIYTLRTEAPGDYTSAGFGLINSNDSGPQAGNAWICVDTGTAEAQPIQPPTSSTVPWQLYQGGFTHTGLINAGSMTVINAVPPDANDTTLVPSSWIRARIAESARLKASIHAEFVAPEAGQQCDLAMPYNATITDLLLVGDAVGSAAISIWRKSLAVPAAADSIGTVSMTDVALYNANGTTGLTSTALIAGDVLRINVDAVSGLGRVTLMLMVDKA